MAPSLYSSQNSRTYISLQPLDTNTSSHTTSHHTEDQEEDQEEVEEVEKEVEVDNEQEQDQQPRRQPRSNLRRAPSQANMHHTTVPQAITPSQLGSRNVNCHIVTASPVEHNSTPATIMESQVQLCQVIPGWFFLYKN